MKVDFEDKNLKQTVENYRQRIKIDQDFNSVSGCIHKVAKEKDELEAAYSLVHESFVKRGYAEPQPSGIRVSIWNASPGCTTVISTKKDQVMATSVMPGKRSASVTRSRMRSSAAYELTLGRGLDELERWPLFHPPLVQ